LEYAPDALLAEGFDGYQRVCADACRLPFPDGTFDCVLTFNTLEHVRAIDVAFAEIDRVTKPRGYLILKPAWHCTRYVTELIPVLPYAELNPRQKLVKLLLPILRSRPYKLLTRLPPRIWRRWRAKPQNPLRWRSLDPYQGPLWTADADATTDIDCHEGILFFESRGYSCLSHPTLRQKLLAGHDIVILRKG
jgi:SAM-dependent methyltransferase